MKLQLKALAAATVASLMVGSVWADSQISSGSTSPLTAKANVNLSLVVPRVIALRIGDATAANTIEFTQVVNGGNWGVNGSDPTIAALFGGTPATSNDANANNTTGLANLRMWTWTNISTGGSITCAMTAGANPIVSSDFKATDSGSGVGHPAGSDLSAQCAGGSSPAATFTALGATPKTDTYTYTFIGNPATYAAGTYTTKITYTASAI